MTDHLNETHHTILLGQFESNKKYKEDLLHEIVAAICAILNSNGGKVTIQFDTHSSIPVDEVIFSQISNVIRILEQHMMSIIEKCQTISKIDFSQYKDSMIISIKKADSLVTVNYHLYLPSQEQVVAVSPSEQLENIKNDVMYRKVIQDPVQLGSHCQLFRKDKNCGFHESKICQFKNPKAKQCKRTTLADRMTGKGNKLSCYVSAFANYSGGHIYYGITDKNVVKGEFIPTQKGKEEITKKVEKTINKMIWPKHIREPKRGDQWEIFFEPVVDPNSKPVPSTFVIVIYVAPCLGGVFTEVPECYEMVEGKVKKMSFNTWKKRTLEPVCGKEEIPCSVARVTWHSAATQKTFTDVSEKLRELINDGKWDDMSRLSASLEEQSPSCEMKLVVLSNQATASYRRGHFNDARLRLKEYMAILPEVKDNLIFEVMGLYIDAALKWARGDLHDLKSAVSEALANAELIEPGLVTATVYSFAASVSDLISLQYPTNTKISNKEKILSVRALEHKEYVKDCDRFCADIKQKVHITVASIYLRCNLSGQSLKDNIAASDLDNARCSLLHVRQSMTRKNPPVSRYYTVQSYLLESMYHYRCSQVSPDQRVNYLRNAFEYANEAECAARDYQFFEMVEWSKTNKALFTEELVRAKLIELNLPFTIDPKV